MTEATEMNGRGGARRAFSPSELEFIRNAREEGKTYREIAGTLGRSTVGVYRKAGEIGIGRRNKRRFTPADDVLITELYAAYEPIESIAAALNRDQGTIRQRILYLGLRRDGGVSRLLETAPDDLRGVLSDAGADAFKAAVREYRAAQETLHREFVLKQAEARRESIQNLTQRHLASEMPRAASIVFMRAIGMTLEEIGQHHGVTRERIRQIIVSLVRGFAEDDGPAPGGSE